MHVGSKKQRLDASVDEKEKAEGSMAWKRVTETSDGCRSIQVSYSTIVARYNVARRPWDFNESRERVVDRKLATKKI
jgi:hypothetical protein